VDVGGPFKFIIKLSWIRAYISQNLCTSQEHHDDEVIPYKYIVSRLSCYTVILHIVPACYIGHGVINLFNLVLLLYTMKTQQAGAGSYYQACR
jgi:hypothetical protein